MSDITDIPNTNNHLFYIDEKRNKFVPCWFFTCERDDAERILLDSVSSDLGNVLMRASTSSGDGRKLNYVISAYSNRKKTILHYRILKQLDGSMKLDIDQKHPPLASLTQAMDCFLEFANHRGIKFKPVNLAKPINSSPDYLKQRKSVEKDFGIYIGMQQLPMSPEPTDFVGDIKSIPSDYLTVQDDFTAVGDPQIGYKNQAAILGEYKNALPNGIQVVQTMNPAETWVSDYLQPDRKKCVTKKSAESAFCELHPSPPKSASSSSLASSSSQNSLKNIYMTTLERETSHTHDKCSDSSPPYDVPKRCQKNNIQKNLPCLTMESQHKNVKMDDKEALEKKEADHNSLDNIKILEMRMPNKNSFDRSDSNVSKKEMPQNSMATDKESSSLYDVPINYKLLTKDDAEYRAPRSNSTDQKLAPTSQSSSTASERISERL